MAELTREEVIENHQAGGRFDDAQLAGIDFSAVDLYRPPLTGANLTGAGLT